jgi:chromosome segregation ATPase
VDINVKALKDFQKVWSPVIESIPQVLEAVAVKSNLEKAIASKQSELDQAKDAVQAVFDKANQELDALKAEAVKIQQDSEESKRQIGVDKADARSAIAKAKSKADAAIASKETRLQELEAKIGSLDSDYAAKAREAERKHGDAVKAMLAEIADLEKKAATAERTLENLRKKLA